MVFAPQYEEVFHVKIGLCLCACVLIDCCWWFLIISSICTVFYLFGFLLDSHSGKKGSHLQGLSSCCRFVKLAISAA